MKTKCLRRVGVFAPRGHFVFIGFNSANHSRGSVHLSMVDYMSFKNALQSKSIDQFPKAHETFFFSEELTTEDIEKNAKTRAKERKSKSKLPGEHHPILQAVFLCVLCGEISLARLMLPIYFIDFSQRVEQQVGIAGCLDRYRKTPVSSL